MGLLDGDLVCTFFNHQIKNYDSSENLNKKFMRMFVCYYSEIIIIILSFHQIRSEIQKDKQKKERVD